MNKSDIRKVISESILADGMSPVIDLEKSHGSWLVDKVTGKEYLDLFSMFASLSVGYNHPYVLEQSERLKVAAINKPTNSDVYSQEMAEFVQTFKRVAQPDYLPLTFFKMNNFFSFCANAFCHIFSAFPIKSNFQCIFYS